MLKVQVENFSTDVKCDQHGSSDDEDKEQTQPRIKTILDHSKGCSLPQHELYPSIDERMSHVRRLVHKRRRRELKELDKHRHMQRIASLAVIGGMLVSALIPLALGIVAYDVYNNVRSLALNGVDELLTVKSLFSTAKSDPIAALDSKKLLQAKKNLDSAEKNFVLLQQLVNRPDVQATIDQLAPAYSSKLTMVKALIRVALDVTHMGRELSSVAITSANMVHGSPLASNSTKPLISATDIAAIEGAVTHACYYIDDIQTQMSTVQLKDLPISDKQQAQLAGLLGQLPGVSSLLTQAQGLIGVGAWLLGVGQPRHFLVQTMDRGELRPSGGFTGQYGVLQIEDGRMAPFSLRDVALLDYGGNGVEVGRAAPPQYRNWMNFGNWGLRDSNLSADYPTTARMSMQVFQDEGGGPVDGDISFTPTFISHILNVTGPIHVAEYNETITAKNLEERLHYYQQNYTAIEVERQKSNDTSHQARKAFTSLVGKLLLERVRHLPVKQLATLLKGAIKDIQSRDLEIYLTDPAAEAWLVEKGYSGAMDSFSQHDGFMVVQANISISKASQYVHTTEHDDIVLDAQGGATHHLTITLNYQQTGPVYGFNTYADYIRVYAPPSAQFIAGNGFDTGQPAQCGPAGCGNVAPTTRFCPDGNYALGDRYYKQAWPIDSLGTPTALSSDLPGYAMWGGLTETPKNCTSTITLSWYVPHAIQHTGGQASYALLVGKQGGYIPRIELTLDASALGSMHVHPFSVKEDLLADTVFSPQ